MLRTELEVLTGKLIRGDITPIVYELIKDSPYIEDIFDYSSVCKEEEKGDTEKDVSRYADNNCGAGLTFQNWLSREVQSVTVPGVRVSEDEDTGSGDGELPFG